MLGFVLDWSFCYILLRYTRKEGGNVRCFDIPLPFDHFFFCFLPAEAAAGACGGGS